MAAIPSWMKDGEPLTVSLLLIVTGLCRSHSEALRLIREGGAYLNNVKVTPPDELIFASDLYHGQYMMLRRGKRYPAVVKFADEPGEDWWVEWAQVTYPPKIEIRS
jgi:tyrosyl-tRNA synthetase